jgi:hypothetical protein
LPIEGGYKPDNSKHRLHVSGRDFEKLPAVDGILSDRSTLVKVENEDVGLRKSQRLTEKSGFFVHIGLLDTASLFEQAGIEDKTGME